MSDITRARPTRRMFGRLLAATFATTLALTMAWATPSSAQSGAPIKVGFSMALTGAVAPNGKQILASLEIWRDDVNAKGGLLGRPVELVFYDDQSNPSNVPGIYTKLLSLDKVDLLLGPYATNMVAPAMPVIMQANKMTISMLAIGVNRHFKYNKYFTMVPVGPEGVIAFSKGFFEVAAKQQPKPTTVAMLAADAEFAKTAADGAKTNAKANGFNIIYDKTYPPTTTDFTAVVRGLQASNADVVFVAAYPPDTVGIIRAAAEIGYTPKMFGGSMIGLLVTPIKVQLGPLMNGLVIMESFVPAPAFNFEGTHSLLERYQAKAAELKIDPLGHGFVPFGYAAGQILAQAVTATKSLDHEKLAAYVHANKFNTVVGEIAYNDNGDWDKPRTVFTQFQDVQPSNVEQFRDSKKQVIVWPDNFKTGEMIYPFANAKK
jgi:branched-chain amino acid transport system substrate-binding protein